MALFFWRYHFIRTVVADEAAVRNPGHDQGLSPSTGALNPPKELLSLQNSFRSIAERVQSAVVSVSAYHQQTQEVPEIYFRDPEDFFYEFFRGDPKRQERSPLYRKRYTGSGSGVLISPEGHVLTNAHVVSGAQEIRVILTSQGKRRDYKGRLLGKDDRLDLALILLEGEKPFPYADLGNSDEVRIGDWAIAIGSPFELTQTFTVGVISAIRQSLPIEGRTYHNLIQTDAAINRGNSGGPLLNIKGEVVGLNTAIFSPSGVFSGIGFAIPINQAKEIFEDLKLGREKQWGWLGISVAEGDGAGVKVQEIFQDGPAAKMGLNKGDVITKINEALIDKPAALTEIVRHTAVGEKVKVVFLRNGNKQEVTLAVGSRPLWADLETGLRLEETPPSASPKEAKQPIQEKKIEDSFNWQGMTLLSLDSSKAKILLKNMKQPERIQEGILIAVINPESPLAGYLEPRDIVRGINSQRIRSIKDFSRVLNTLNLNEGIVFEIIRKSNHQFISIQIGE